MTEPSFQPDPTNLIVGVTGSAVPRQSKDALSFPLLLKRECARVRWITDNPFPVKDDA
ncbi:hypothetical protein FBY31_2261 [Arthrobacter sp. SLBN-100]|nr:hypothetical protein FBY31_2261 [Arthrobacter sp. SLBN-100]